MRTSIDSEKISILCLHMGQRPLEESWLIHVRRQCWRGQSYKLLISVVSWAYHVEGVAAGPYHYSSSAKGLVNEDGQGPPSHKAQSSPGYLQVGQVPSNCTRQIPQTSSSGMSQRHDATAFHSLIVTFILRSVSRIDRSSHRA